MPTSSRRAILPQGEDCVVHAVSRCVRRAWLCGQDPYTGQDYEHRRGWVRERVRELSGVFAIEVCAYAVMSNHTHLVLWCRPSVAAQWSAEEVARRWLGIFGRGQAGGRADQEADLAGDAQRVAQCRERLGSVSWFMRCLNEKIARRANAEDGCTGRFWEGRFKCQLLEDEGAVLACMAYVDLNPVRAKVSQTLEGSEFTSIHDRLVGRRARAGLAAVGEGEGEAGKGVEDGGTAGRRAGGGSEGATKEAAIGRSGGGDEAPVPAKRTLAQRELIAAAREQARADAWLSPFAAAGEKGGKDGKVQDGEAESPRALDLSEEEYLALVEWTGRSLAEGKRGALPEEMCPVLERLELETKEWVETVASYGGLFHRVAGSVESLRRRAEAMGQRWLAGVGMGGKVFRGARRAA